MSDSCCAVDEPDTRIEYAKFAGLLAAIGLVATLLYNLGSSSGAAVWVRLFAGVFLIAFGVFKLLGFRNFVEGFPQYDLLGSRLKQYAQAYPFIEIALGLLLVFDLFSPWPQWGVLIIMGIGSVSIFKYLLAGSGKVECACLGGLIKLPLSVISLTETVLMFLMAAWMLAV